MYYSYSDKGSSSQKTAGKPLHKLQGYVKGKHYQKKQ